MKLRSLKIDHLPGVDPGFSLEGLADGVNVVVGPNASGKSSLVRAVGAALYRDALRKAQGLSVAAVFDTDEGTLQALRLGTQLSWRRGGEDAEPPALPEYRFLSCFTLRMEDLLAERFDTDQAIAAYLARELAGGFDIRAVREGDTFPRKQSYRREFRAFQAARATLRQRREDARRLKSREDRLQSLQAEVETAKQAGEEAQRLAKALELLAAHRHRLDLEAQLAAFPPHMDRLRGDETDQLTELRKRRRTLEQTRERTTVAQSDARQRRASTGLDGTALDDATLNEQRSHLQALHTLETRIEGKRQERAEAQARLDRATTDLGGTPPAQARLDLNSVRDIEARLEEKRALDGEIRALDEALARLPTVDEAPDAAPLDNATQALRDWLRAPAAVPWSPLRTTLVTVLALSALAGIGLASLATTWAAFLLLPFAAALVALLRERPGEAQRNAARAAFAATPAQPPVWEPESVRNRLDEIEAQARADRRRQDLLSERDGIDNKLAQRRRDHGTVIEKLSSMTAGLGRDPVLQDIPLDRWLRLTVAHDEARDRLATIDRQLGEDEARAADLHARAVEFLKRYDAAPEDGDAGVLSAHLDQLASRLRDHRTAQRDETDATRELERCRNDLLSTDEAIARVFHDAHIEANDDAALSARLDRLDAWRKTVRELDAANAVERARTDPLRDDEALLGRVAADDEAGLRRDRDTRRHEAARYEDLVREISDIQAAIRRADHDRAVEAAGAEAQRCLETLQDSLQEALLAEAGACLLEQVEHEYIQHSQPRALRQAQDWFARFTRHAWQLQFTGGDTPFCATESATGQRRALGELSTGTRMQLLLAVRMAFATEAERGREPLPLFLDETLATTDPARFDAVARSLQTLAEDGRQLFYLTAQPMEVQHWQRIDPGIHCVDLARARRLAAAADTYADVTANATPGVPPPGDRSAADYAALLQVPQFDPWQAPEAVHPFYLLPDDLDLLHELLELGLDSAGALASLLADPDSVRWLSPAQRALLERRIAGARTWITAWRQGRGRPADRAALEASGAVSDRFINDVAALNRQLNGDSDALLQALDGGAIKGFRSDKREQLGEWLATEGYRDERPRLADSDITVRVMKALQSASRDGTAQPREVRLLCDTLGAGIGTGIDSGQDNGPASAP